jgi:hypothetical protein
MKLIEVSTPAHIKSFLELPVKINKGDDQWIRPLDKDIEAVFDKKKNKYFRHGECTRWLLFNDKQEVIGRVAAFINKKTAKTFDQPTGGMGFFECINDKEAAFLLFDTCKQWLKEREMEAMDGPINFGEKDRWWGLLVDGFYEPVYCINYNQPYYRNLFEDYGFKTYYEQYYYMYIVDKPVPSRYGEKSDRIARDPAFTADHLHKKNIEKYTQDFLTVYNNSWGKHAGFKAMGIEQARSVMKSIAPIMDEDIIWFAYNNGNPIAFFIMLPEINQLFKHINNGKLGWIEMARFAWLRWRGKCRKMFAVVFGVVPEFQGKGVEGYVIMSAAKHVQPLNRYDKLEMTWIGDFNPKMIHLVESLGTEKTRTQITFRYLFDRNREFKRAPIIE